MKGFSLILSLLFCLNLFAQESEHSPKKATLLSAFLPGAGQIYNKKYWKLPIVYGALGASVYALQENQSQYSLYRQAYLDRVDGDPNTVDPFDPNNPTVGNPSYTESNLLTLIDFYQKNRDLSYIAFAGVWVLQIIDANVDAHLYEFDVSDDLTLSWNPVLLVNNYQAIPNTGLAIRCRF